MKLEINKFYRLDYAPNKIVFIHSIDTREINFLVFLNENKQGLKAVKHSVSIKLKNDFKKPITCFNPTSEIQKIINDFLIKN